MYDKITIKDIIKAGQDVYKFLKPTPLRHYQILSDMLETDVWLKHENHNPTCAFKVRGGIHLMSTLTEEQKSHGVYTASTGNHGQSIAFSAREFGVKANVFVPKGANPGKVESMRAFGANVEFYGDDFDQARAGALQAAQKNKAMFIGPTDDVLIKGVGTYGLEIINELPDVDVIIVPVGAGSGVCGTAIVAKSINPKIKIIGVQSAQAPAQQLSWKISKLIEAENHTIAEGVATGVPFMNTQEIMWELVDDFVLVDDEEIISANKILIEITHNLIEEASAATFAAALKLKSALKGKKVVLVMSGGNISMKNLSSLFSGV